MISLTHPIDLVISWVDGEDPDWLKARARAQGKTLNFSDTLNHASRYREIGLLRYALRSVEDNLPWVRKIYLVTPGQKPHWLALNHPKLEIINQDDIIDPAFLPCFKSTTVEWFLHKIPGLSEHFIYMNDDMLFNRSLSPQDFFVDGLPKLTAIYRPIPINDFSHMVLSTLNAVNRNFTQGSIVRKEPKKFLDLRNGKEYIYNYVFRSLDILSKQETIKTTYEFPHVALPLRKSTIEQIWEAEKEQLEATCKRTFRDYADVLIWLAMFWEIEQGTFLPQSTRETRFIPADNFSLLEETLKDTSVGLYCVNDSEDITDLTESMNSKLCQLMEGKYPKKSSYEV